MHRPQNDPSGVEISTPQIEGIVFWDTSAMWETNSFTCVTQSDRLTNQSLPHLVFHHVNECFTIQWNENKHGKTSEILTQRWQDRTLTLSTAYPAARGILQGATCGGDAFDNCRDPDQVGRLVCR